MDPRGWEPEGHPRGVTLEGGMEASASPGRAVSSVRLGSSRESLQGTGCAGGHGDSPGCTRCCHPQAGSRAGNEPVLGETRACGVGISSWRDFRGGLTTPDRLCQRLLAHGLCLPHLPRERGLFQPLSPANTLLTPIPSHHTLI